MNPIIDDQMNNEDIEAVFEYAKKQHGMTPIENGKISKTVYISVFF